ncbi:TonB-dependent receptor [Ancylomarina sp. DW003]|nr:TonB-dependent receptor [Ancylomarina sp. DW003]MDE5422012.1 TonB-dependent receptor [Ancylomarina sp. DW003]
MLSNKKKLSKHRESLKIPKKTLLIAFVLMLIMSVQSFATVSVVEQGKVIIKEKSIDLDDLIWKLEKQSGYDFVFNSELLGKYKNLNVNLEGNIDEVLTALLKDKALTYEVENGIYIIRKKEKQSVVRKNQQVKKNELWGRVTDENGDPLPGVSVVVKGTTIGSATNIDGEYRFLIPANAKILIFSFIGMLPTELLYERQSEINVVLKADTEGLDEVVVLGYGTISREKATGSTTKVDPLVLKNTQNVSYADALIGIVPGLLIEEDFSNPDAAPEILLRGIGSISAKTDPLVVVDGVQMPSGFNSSTINSSDIEGISILKDASATSIYGSRGSNGVIIISTKRGKKNMRPQVSFNATYGFKTPDKSFTDDIMNASEKLNYEESLGLYPEADATAQALLAERRASGNNVNWSDIMLDNETSQKYDLSIAGGNEKTNYYASVAYNKVDNIYGSNYERLTATLKFDYELAKNLTLGLSGTFGNVNNKDRRTTGDPVSNSFLLNPWEDVYDEKGELQRNLKYAPYSSGIVYNPLFVRENTDVKSVRKNIYGNAKLTYKATDWLTLSGNLGGNYNHSKSSEYQKIIVEGGKLRINNGDNTNYTGTLMATIDKSIDKHDFNLVLGTEFNEDESYNFNAYAKNFLSDAVQTINTAKDLTSYSERTSESGSMSYFSRLNYSFDRTYNLSLSIRRDGSSKFGGNNKWANFWAIGGSWNIHKNLNNDESALSTLKLRGSYGTSGNDFIGDFDHLSLYEFRKKYEGTDVAALARGDNPSLTWEKNTNKNVGLDVGLFNNSFYATFDYYIRDTYDLINTVPIPLQSGFSTLTSNIGDFRNKGLEVSLRTTNISNKDFMWTSSLNFSFNKSEVLKLTEDDEIIQRGNTAYKEGESIGALYIVEWAGVNPDTGYNQYVNPDATGDDDRLVDYVTNQASTNRADITELKRVSDKVGTPKYHGGLTNTFNYKNFDATFLISFAGGHHVINSGNHDLRNDVWLNQHKSVNQAWKQAGDDAKLAVRALNFYNPLGRRVESDYESSTQFLQKGDYVKLKTMTIGYTLNERFSKKIGMDRLRVYIQGQNLFTITDVDYIDPEYAGNGGIGLSSTSLRGFSFGLSANF